jgi:CBS domain-containing protein
MKTGVKVMDAMTHAPVVAKPTSTLQECAKLMFKRKLGNVLIINKEKLKGIITEKDLVRAVVAKGFDPKKTLVEEIMTKKVKTISPNKDIIEAMQHMQASKTRRLPVVFKNNVIGIITDKDIIKLQPAILELIAERGKIKKAKKEKYIEGLCDSCESYARLQEKNGNFICEECIDQL